MEPRNISGILLLLLLLLTTTTTTTTTTIIIIIIILYYAQVSTQLITIKLSDEIKVLLY